jgi:Transposase DDE domain
MLINEVKLIQLFCEIDDFTRVYEQKLAGHLLPVNPNSKHSIHKPSISLSEMMTIEILYHLSGHKCFEYYYRQEVLQGSLKSYFPHAPSYNRFVELKPRMLVALIGYLHCLRLGRLLGLYYADSTALKVCHQRRIHSHRVFASSAKRGMSSTGWFYGFKLFLVVNGLGELVQAFVTPANVADNALATLKRLFKGLTGLAFADKGFASPQKAFPVLYEKGLKLITYIRSNMKNKLVLLQEKMLLKKRGMIESVIDILKSVCNIEHTRHRSPLNMIVNTYAALCAYSTLERKPSIFVR